MRSKDGTWIWILGRGRVVEHDEVGRPVLLSGTNTDITERKRAGEELKAAMAKAEEGDRMLTALMESVPEGITICDAAGNIRMTSRHGQNLLGGQHAGKSIEEVAKSWIVYRPDGRTVMPMDKLPLIWALKGETVQNVELIQVNKEGRKLPLLCNAAPIRDATGAIVGGIVAWRDITALKQAEAALREREERLSASLAEKEILLKEIHHRVKNNMQVISSLVDLQADEVKDDAVRGIFQDIIYRVRSMAMVHEKLYQSADLSRVDFGDYAQSLLQYLWRAQGAANGGFQLDLELESILMPVNAAVPCGLILNELFSNALKHAFRGREGGRVTVRLREDGAGRARLDVCDDGVGFPAGFDWRSAPSLGLRLVQMLARQLNAAVELESANGTTFTITFEVHQS
jgi:PAS domain S-box-containing protein